MDVAVVGAGIGGLALTHGLLAGGHRVRVYERRPGPSTGGAAVTIYSNGAAALAGLGVRIADLGAPIDGLEIGRSDGRVLMRTGFAPLAERAGFGVRTVPRAALIERLAEGLPAGVVEYAAGVLGVTAAGDRPAVTLDRGALPCDVAVGADGYRSVVRRDVLGGAPAREVGWLTWQGLSAVLPRIAGGRTGQLRVGDAGLVGLMPAGAGLAQWWFDVRWAPGEPLPGDPAGWLRERFATYADPVPQLLDAITNEDLGSYPHVVHNVPDAWGSGATTLLGDAAHAFPPSQAQGANQALEDAWLLARALRGRQDAAALAPALRAYEARRGPRVRRISRLAESERTNRPPSAALALAARLTPAGVSSRAYARLIRSVSSVLNDDARHG